MISRQKTIFSSYITNPDIVAHITNPDISWEVWSMLIEVAGTKLMHCDAL